MKYFDVRDAIAIARGLLGNETGVFEKEFASFVGSRFAVGTSFGRTALYLGLKAMGDVGREVILPSFTCTVVREAVIRAGDVARFVDVDADAFAVDLDDLRKKMGPNTKAVVLTHFFGRVARNLTDVVEMARERGVGVIEDCAHALGASFAGEKVGNFGDFGVFSLTKSTINFGGGVLVTDNPDLYERAKEIRDRESRSVKTRIADFPLVLAYGLKEMVEKLLLDRGRKGRFVESARRVPGMLIEGRRFVMKGPRKRGEGQRGLETENGLGGREIAERVGKGYPQGIGMARVIAALGRSQVKKVERLTEQREVIWRSLSEIEEAQSWPREEGGVRDAHTFVIFRFQDQDIADVSEACGRRGIRLCPTWPTHQRLWDGQDTESVRRIAGEVLCYNVNPMLKARQLDRFRQVVRELP